MITALLLFNTLFGLIAIVQRQITIKHLIKEDKNVTIQHIKKFRPKVGPL